MSLKNKTERYIRFAAYIVAAILINAAGMTLFFRADLTENKIYSLSEASKNIVSSLSEPLTIKIFFSKNLPAPHNNTERYLRDLLEEYAIYGNKFFNYQFYDVSPEQAGEIEVSENKSLASSYGIFPVQIQAMEEDEVKFIKAYMGGVLIHGDTIEKLDAITSTDGLEYLLTTSILKLSNKTSALLNLDEKIKVKLFLSSSLEAVAPFIGMKDMVNLPSHIEEIVTKLNKRNYGKLEFVHLDPTQDPALNSEIKKYNILHFAWPDFDQKDIKAGNGNIGLVISCQDRSVSVELVNIFNIPIIGTKYQLTELEEIEEAVEGAVSSIIDINKDIGVLADHRALDIYGGRQVMNIQQLKEQDNASNIRVLMEQNYSIKNIVLNDGIPAGIKCLVIAGPKEKFTDYELFQIDQFLMKGNNIAFFIDSYDQVQGRTIDQPARYVPVETGIKKMLEHYGVNIKQSYVMDKKCYRDERSQRPGGGWQDFYFAPMIEKKNINNELDFMKNINGLVMLKVSPIYIDKEKIDKNGLKAYKIASSSDKSWEMEGEINLNPMFIMPPRILEEFESKDLAYVIEGEFPSYFADKKIPEKIIEDKEEDKAKDNLKKESKDLPKIEDNISVIKKGKPGKIFVLPSSDMLTDSIIDRDGRTSVSIFIINVLDFLNNREDIAVMRGKRQSYNPLIETGPAVKTFLKSLNIVGIPILAILFGLAVFMVRSSRKRRIKAVFDKNVKMEGLV